MRDLQVTVLMFALAICSEMKIWIFPTLLHLIRGEATTERNPHPILHTTDYVEMLRQAHETEIMAGKVYGEILEALKSHNDDELYDAIESIYFAELRSVEEVRMLLN